MNHAIPDILLSRLSEFVAAQMGLHFPKERWPDLERGIGSAAREFERKDTASCIQWLVSSPLTKNQLEVLASHLTVGETYFFREKRSFEVLEEEILPALIRSRRETERSLRIWSAGCCTGEEPYSIAILLDRLIPDVADWHIALLATDINPRFLQKATDGVYSQWSFRDTPSWIKGRYFTESRDGRFEILPDLKRRVTFSYLNLAEDAYPSLLNNTNGMDLILCRNVLMYFAPERAERAIHSLYRSLVDGGWLIVSPTEASHVLYPQFATVHFPGATLYKKDSEKSQTAEGLPPTWASFCPSPEAPEVSFRPPVDVVAEQEVTFPQEVREPLPLEVQAAKTAQPTPYAEALGLYEQGHYVGAEERLLGLFSDDPANSKAIALLARVYANQGKLTEALEWCEKAIAADRLNPGGYYLLATILQEQERAEEAVTSLKRALYLDQNFVLAHVALGNLTLRQGKFKESNRHFENALSLMGAYRKEEILPESEGMTAGRLAEIISSNSLRRGN